MILTGIKTPNYPNILSIQAPASLSQLFIKFLESESTSRSSKAATSSQVLTGYVDPLTDPDKPTLSTASLLGPALQAKGHNKSTDSPTTSVQTGNVVARTTQNIGVVQTQSTSPLSFQSSLLQNVLTD